MPKPHEGVINSAEVEQEIEQANECKEGAICANVAGAQLQTGVNALVINTGNFFDDSNNIAKVEQETEQDNKCEGLVTCANVGAAQAQTGVATVANTGNFFDDIPNAAEIEQQQEQSNECQDFAACANVAGAQGTNSDCNGRQYTDKPGRGSQYC